MTVSGNEKLQAGLSQLHLAVSEEKQAKLIQYLHLLKKWNKAYNLTAITDFDKMISYHLLDSLSVAPHVTGNNIVDVGSGAGLPGIPLAIFYPDKKFTLIDSIGKKTRFISQVVRELKLMNVEVANCRAEEYPSKHSFDTMIARAVGSVEMLVDIATVLLEPGGNILLMKSNASEEQINRQHQIISLQVPGVDSARSLIVMQQKT
jgi:16S rRNA (guanine527-N7)-methyltransferase